MNQQHSSDQKPSFLDRGTIIALVLVGVVWFGWSKWVEKMYPQPATTQSAAAKPSPLTADAANSTGQANLEKPAAGSVATQTGKSTSLHKPAEVQLPIENKHWTSKLSSLGMGLSVVELKDFKTRDEKPIFVGATPDGLFTTRLLGSNEPIPFFVEKKSENEWVGSAQFDGFQIEKTMAFLSEGSAADHAVKISIIARGDLTRFPGFTTVISDEVKAPVSTSFLAPSYDHHDWYVRYEDTNKRVVIAPDSTEELKLKTALVVALSSHYFTAAIADHSDLRPDFHGQVPRKLGETFAATGTLDYKPASIGKEFRVEQIAYIGAKDVDALRSADPDFARVVDYGMFAVFAEPLLWLMRFFFGLFGNWGFAIIGLTLVVRAVVLPANLYSFKSMKVMQKIQPQIQQVKEKFKDDPKRMNEEVMRLMKENKANPIGGCLPMLIQLPVFFALYQVLAQSMELYRQPFIFWIHDLTVKDQFFVLPVLMGIAMFFQQKLTPVADPQQAKVLQWMPVIFSLLMFTLPSGLTLYILVSTVFGIAQQYVFLKDKSVTKSQNNVHVAKA